LHQHISTDPCPQVADSKRSSPGGRGWGYLFLVAVALLTATLAAALDRQPSDDYRARRVALSERIEEGMVLLFAADESSEGLTGFRQDSNFFYLTGWTEPGAAMLLVPAGAGIKSYTEILFLPAHNVTRERWTGPKLGADNTEAARLAGFDRVEVLDKLREDIVRLTTTARLNVYSDLPEYGETSPATTGLDWLKRANAFPYYTSFRDVKPLLATMRASKDSREIERLRKATEASMAAHRAAMRAIKPGMTELQVAALMENEFKRAGCERPAFAPIVGSGANSTVLHYSQNSGTIQAGDLIVIDMGGEYAMYASDITRTLPASGKFTARQREIYDIVLGAQQAAIAAFKQGVSTIGRSAQNSIHQAAYDYINTHGKDLQGRPLGEYFIHGLSHYVGLDVHDAGDTDLPVPKGAVFTIEPGIYLPEEKIGVRIEDMFWVDLEGNLVRLTEGLPRTAAEIERAMAE
jgi:Xaa-Pro aminopeptidase